MKKMITKSKEETQKFAGDFAKKILSKKQTPRKAIIIGLIGNLGAGKTTFIQGFAKGLGIKKKIISPTFVILKKIKITKRSKIQSRILGTKSKISSFKNLIHIDAYRLENPHELLNLGWRELLNNSQNIILIEWADKIKKILPKNHIKINFKFIDETKREMSIKK